MDDSRGVDPSPRLPPEFDGFEILQPLGRGGMGTVYLGRDVMLDRPVALKFISSRAPSARSRERFLLEARALARLHHPNVVGIYRIGNVEGHPYVAYELVAGRGLHQVERPVPWRLALSIALTSARGLAAVHRRGILHRDIKPANMILLADGEVKLLDFGLAKLSDGELSLAPPRGVSTDLAPTEPGGGDPEQGPSFEPVPSPADIGFDLTSVGSLAGTPAYMAPELWRGEPASARSDLYALGLVLHELLVGSLPWATHGQDASANVLAREVPSLVGLRNDVPRPLLVAIDRLTRRDPRDRVRTADELCAQLEEINATYQPFTDPAPDTAADDEAVLQDSFARIAGDADRFAETFYNRVFDARPELRSLFPVDMTEQRRKLVTTLQLMVRNLQRSEVVVPMLIDLGARHAHYGTRTDHFPVIGEALLDALARCDAGAWSDELERAWSFAYQRLASTMITALEQQMAVGSDPASPAGWTPAPSTPRTRYVRSGEVSLAYQLFGSGPLSLVMVPHWVSHLELAWQEPSYAHFLRQLSARARVLLIDRRGTGLSDRITDGLTLDCGVADLKAVMDEAGFERAALLGVGDGAPLCAALATSDPDRVQSVVLCGCAAGADADELDATCDTVRARWGAPLFLERCAPSRVDDPRFASWWASYLRTGASPAGAEALLRAAAEVDVPAALRGVRAPTLFLCDGSRAEHAELAACVPHASTAVIDGADHPMFASEPGATVEAIASFLFDLPTEDGHPGRGS